MFFELTIKDSSQLKQTIKLLKRYNIKKVNVTHKDSSLPTITIISALKNEVPSIQIIPHFSLALLKGPLKQKPVLVENTLQELQQCHCNQILLITGNPPSTIDTLTMLNYLHDDPSLPNLGVAYNPYIPTFKAQQFENEHLTQKLLYKKVTAVYLQIGTKTEEAENAVIRIKTLRPEIQIYASLLIPNNHIRNAFQLRTWHGVYLEDQYLTDQQYAEQKTQEIYHCYKQLNITPLLTIIPFTEKNIDQTLTLLQR